MKQAPQTETSVNPMNTGMAYQWSGNPSDLVFSLPEIRKCLLNFGKPVFVVKVHGQIGYSNDDKVQIIEKGLGNIAGMAFPIGPDNFGDPKFRHTYGVSAAYCTGGMANAIASEALVISLGKAGFMGSFGSGGLSLDRISKAIDTIQSDLKDAPYLFNLLHNPFEPHVEQSTVDLYLEKNIRVVEAAAYINLTPAIIQYRAAGLSKSPDGRIQIKNHIIAKISRKEVAQRFLQPAPDKELQALVSQSKITQEQAVLAGQVPMADDITVEADSGGHTDNQPLVSLLPSIIALRDRFQNQYSFTDMVRIGAAGGISLPGAVLAAFMMGAAYVVTGSINQACVESGASDHTKLLLSQAEMADVTMAPSADMFEMGARVQVLKRGCLFPLRAQKLYDLYTTYSSLDELPADIKRELEEKVFKCKIADIWTETETFFEKRDPEQILKAARNPKKKMALVFRWYLGLASRWSRDGVEDRQMDYQIWCGPAMGAFNEWAQGTYLEQPENRKCADLGWQLMNGCTYLSRIQSLKMQGVEICSDLESFLPQQQV